MQVCHAKGLIPSSNGEFFMRGRSLILTNDYCLGYVRIGPDCDNAVAIS
jgi:hypothetical protein